MVLEIAREIKEKHGLPIVILTYFNPIFRMGIENFFQSARSCRVDGVVVPDLPVEEAGDYKKVAEACGVDTIFLAAPSTSNERLDKIIACTSGFLYLVSHFGVTGERDKIEESTIKLVKRVAQQTKGRVPVAVGFGVSKTEHVRAIIEAGADGVIVGSAFVNVIQRNKNNISEILKELEELARQLKAATVKQAKA
jgi:tryptophan synthase alpha chain